MPNFEIYDTVVAKIDRSLVGTVERTHASTEGYDLLDDHFILAYLPVANFILEEFVTSGVPPKGYVFVSTLDEERGSFLAHEDDLTLLCRSFDLGDLVKRSDGTTGTVVDVQDSYSIQPLWLEGQDITPASRIPKDHLKDCDPAKSDPCPHNVISAVPGPELTLSQNLFEDDLICYKEWLGVVQEVDFDVVIKFADGAIVVIDSPDDLAIPVTDPEIPLVSLPELDQNQIRRPDLPSAFMGHSWTIPTKYPRSSTVVVTSKSTLRAGRWVQGKYSPQHAEGGIVIDLIPRQLVIQWLSCNPFAPLKARQVTPPAPVQNLYSNHSSYRSRSDLRQNPHLAVIDLLSSPRSEVLRKGESSPDSQSNPSHDAKPANMYQDLKLGDCVRFRDSGGAAVKYQGSETELSGCFNRISESPRRGWDFNVFKVVAKQQQVSILWQDGSIVSHTSSEIQRFGGFEPDFAPTDIVVHRAGLKQMREGDVIGLKEFNEMTFFETPHTLHPATVGVIQSVDARERIAKVRWFQAPTVSLLEYGHRISAASRLGPIGDIIEEVSLYEVMTFPAFDRKLRDVVLLSPRNPSKRAMEIIHSTIETAADHRHAASTSILDPQRIFFAVRDIIRQRGLFKLDNTLQVSEADDDDSGVDWLGEIINTGLDGSVTVRLSGAQPCHDVKVSPDEILAIIQLDYLGADEADEGYSNQSMDADDLLDEFYDDDESISTISEHVEYEGGERMDTDSDDENWESAEEDQQDGDDDEDLDKVSSMAQLGDTDMPDAPSLGSIPRVDVQPPAGPPQPHTSESSSFLDLHSHLLTSSPLPFEILSIEPPADQYQPATPAEPPTSSSFLKRVRHEHKVLASSLPTNQIYVRTYDSRLDLLRCLIIGPPDTPYEHAPFLVDLYLPPQFPLVPPTAHFHSWTSGLGRINPNLYEEGKICLSLLGTWPGKASEEGWSAKATILQVLVSLQGLVMVQNPFYNEAGFENEEVGGGYVNESAMYSERAFVMARGFVRFALTRPPVSVQDVLAWLYLPLFARADESLSEESDGRLQLLQKVVERGQKLIDASEAYRIKTKENSNSLDQTPGPSGSRDESAAAANTLMDGAGDSTDATKTFLRPLSKGAVVMLTRQLHELNGYLEE